ncbi:MAG: hypothetical protein AVDCRST_MAG52-2799, partial [uncultured Blastococcus sp.]
GGLLPGDRRRGRPGRGGGEGGSAHQRHAQL